MCNLNQTVKEEGHQEERLLLLRNLMKNMKMPMEQAVAMLEIPDTELAEIPQAAGRSIMLLIPAVFPCEAQRVFLSFHNLCES